jgi:hypothetical protein
MNDNDRDKENKQEERQDQAQKPELSRREFLYIAGVFGMTPVVNGVDPFQTIRKAQTAKPKVEQKVALPVRNLVISCLRADDLLALDFECINLVARPGAPPKLVRENASAPAYLVVHFPPQSIAEQAFFETTPDYKPDPKSPPEPTTAETPKTPPVLSRISGPTRLAFLIPSDVKEIPLTLESLLSWEMYEPSLVPVALPPKLPQQVSREPRPAAFALPLAKSGQNLYQMRISKVPAQLNLNILKLAPPAGHQTAVEMPYRLILSPHALNVWRHSLQAVTRNGRTELWHTSLGALNPDGTVSETDHPYLAVRAVWARDFGSAVPAAPPNHSNEPFRMSLDGRDRYEIVNLTSNFSLKLAGKPWETKPVAVNRLMLTSLGAWLDSEGVWVPTPITVEGWRHRATLGRDHYVKVVYKGFLLPFGHAASLIKVTERKFRKGGDGQAVAYLFQRMYIVVRKPEKSFPAPFQPNDGRQVPFRKVRITTPMTPPLEDPARTEMFSGALQSAFWPQVSMKDFRFHCVAVDWAGNESEFDMPMPFIDAEVAFNANKVQSVIGTYNQSGEAPRRRPPLNGQKVAFAVPKKKGDTELETDSIAFSVAFPGGRVSADGFREADQPLFFPVMEDASVSIPALKSLVQLGATRINYPKTYITSGLGGPNKGEVFAAIASAPAVNFGSGGGGGKSGGVATPSFSIVGLSRALGPVGGKPPSGGGGADPLAEVEDALADVIGGKFDPKKFFDDQAKLLGGLLLGDIVKAVADFMSSPDSALVIKNEVVEDANKLPVEIHTFVRWKPELKDFSVFVASRDGRQASLTIDAKTVTYLNAKPPYSELKGELKDFTLDMIRPAVTFIRVGFEKFTFTSKTGQKTDFDPKIAKIEFAGPLNFIKELLDKIKLPGSGGDGGGFGSPIIQVDSSRARLGYTFNIPSVAFGVFTLQNISFTGLVTLPFTGDPVSLRFAFNERSNPFLLTVSLFGGGGFFAIELNPDGIKLIEGSLEFGGSFSMNLGVASGGVTLMAGIYFKYEADNITITGYVRCAGCLDVLGIISISAEFYLSLTYEQATNKVWGQASLTVKIKVLFFSAKVTLKVERSFGHSPAPLFADMMDEGHWLSYCEAFA